MPEDCVGYITGKGGAVLRSLEEEWGTLMFFARSKADQGSDEASGLQFQQRRPIGRSSGGKGATEKLAIFGSRRGRRGAELKVMSAVEHKKHGWFVDHAAAAFKRKLDQPGDDENRGDGWGYGTRKLGPNDFSYALGSKGSTRKKLAAASGAISWPMLFRKR